MLIRILGCALLLIVATTALPRTVTRADEPRDPDQPRRIELTLAPAPEPVPALKYALLPPLGERKPGNGAPYYHRSALAMRSLPVEISQEVAKWDSEFGEDSLGKVPRERLQRWLTAHQRVIEEARTAAYREHCDWELRIQDLRGLQNVTFILEEFQQLRAVERAVLQKARLDIADGRFVDGIDSIRVGYQLARDVTECRILICSLIGIACAEQTNERVEQLIGSSGSPNLYWSLANLPRPLVDCRAALEMERTMPERIFPFLKDAETAERTPDEWQKLLSQMMSQFQQLASDGSLGRESSWQEKVQLMALVATGYPRAKRELIAAGLDRDRVEQMPVGQVIAIHVARTSQKAFDDMAKSAGLPYPQAIAWCQKIERRMAAEHGRTAGGFGDEIIPLGRILLPAVSQIVSAEARLERNLAAIQVIEAIRLHLAANGGKLPDSLSEITIVPVPLNPASGQPFPYRLEGDHAVLDVLAENPSLTPYYGKQYVLRAKAK